MIWKNTDERWGIVSQGLHWLVVVLIIAIAAIGLTMGDLPNSPDKIRTYALHKSLGLTVLGLALLRLAWRLWAGAPAPVAGTPRWQERIATLAHAGLYLLLFAMPLTGWLFNSAAGYPLQWFGLFNLPRLVARDADLRELAGELHEAGFWLLVLLVSAHAGAALYHHFLKRDATLSRMLPRWPRRPPENPHA